MKDKSKQKKANQAKRAGRTRAKIFSVGQRPRFCVFRSNKHIYVQIIDDSRQKTLISASDLELKKKSQKSQLAKMVGTLAAQKAVEAKIKKVVFDRGGYKYHGRLKAVAEGAREGGLEF